MHSLSPESNTGAWEVLLLLRWWYIEMHAISD